MSMCDVCTFTSMRNFACAQRAFGQAVFLGIKHQITRALQKNSLSKWSGTIEITRQGPVWGLPIICCTIVCRVWILTNIVGTFFYNTFYIQRGAYLAKFLNVLLRSPGKAPFEQ